jgi:hypothetical protein
MWEQLTTITTFCVNVVISCQHVMQCNRSSIWRRNISLTLLIGSFVTGHWPLDDAIYHMFFAEFTTPIISLFLSVGQQMSAYGLKFRVAIAAHGVRVICRTRLCSRRTNSVQLGQGNQMGKCTRKNFQTTIGSTGQATFPKGIKHLVIFFVLIIIQNRKILGIDGGDYEECRFLGCYTM